VDSRLRFLEDKYQKIIKSNLETESKLSEHVQQAVQYKKLNEQLQIQAKEYLEISDRQKQADLQVAELEVYKKDVSLIKEAELKRQTYVENCANY
jgi:hypothetical protein